MWDKNISKPDIKTCVFPYINFHNLQVISRLSMTLSIVNLYKPLMWVPKLRCVHPSLIEQYQNL